MVVASAPWKGSLSAREAGEAIAAGLADAWPGAAIEVVPIADGGEGTGVAMAAAGFTGAQVLTACDALGRPVEVVCRADGAGARVLVESAAVCGLPQLAPGERDPAQLNTAGLAAVARALAQAGPARTVIVAIGGTATVDGGTGFLRGLGARLFDGDGRVIDAPNPLLAPVARVDLDGIDPAVRDLAWSAWIDVKAPLLGPTGAARAFGPQKGAGPELVERLERAMAAWAEALAAATGRDPRFGPAGMGGGGGLPAALWTVFGAECRLGAEAVLAATGLAERLAGADWLVTGEGRLDATTAQGKAPLAAARLAAAAGVRSAWVVGGCAADAEPPAGALVEPAAPDGEAAAPADIRRAARNLAKRLETA